jgi:ATP-dependent RNA helicase SUPV3L1/SUV3
LRSPNHEALTRAPVAEDMRVLDHAARDARYPRHGAGGRGGGAAVGSLPDSGLSQARAGGPCRTGDHAVRVPDAQGPDSGRLVRAQVAQADRTDGDIDTLSARIAQIRTWTFAANRPDWLADPEHWQGIARAWSRINCRMPCMNG